MGQFNQQFENGEHICYVI